MNGKEGRGSERERMEERKEKQWCCCSTKNRRHKKKPDVIAKHVLCAWTPITIKTTNGCCRVCSRLSTLPTLRQRAHQTNTNNRKRTVKPTLEERGERRKRSENLSYLWEAQKNKEHGGKTSERTPKVNKKMKTR